MRILAIETSCDETAIALVEATGGLRSPKFKILKNIVSSQIEIHRPWGGVVPNLAKREHLKNLPVVFQELLDSQNKRFQPDLLAVTVGPGLEPALWAGIGFAKEIKKNYFMKQPLIGVNHLEGHLYSFLLPKTIGERVYKTKGLKSIFPAIALIVSGGHTILLLMESLTKWKKLGETVDDAVGEAFDKVAKMMGLPYPGGPEISRLAKNGNRAAIAFPRPMIHTKNYNFSYSGLKTSVLYFLRDQQDLLQKKTSLISPARKSGLASRSSSPADGNRARQSSETLFIEVNPAYSHAITLRDVAASFEEAAVDVLVKKTMRAIKEFGAKSVLLSGGVAANTHLRETLTRETKKIKRNFFVPPISFNTDNATMIATAAYISYLHKKNLPASPLRQSVSEASRHGRPLRANGRMNI